MTDSTNYISLRIRNNTFPNCDLCYGSIYVWLKYVQREPLPCLPFDDCTINKYEFLLVMFHIYPFSVPPRGQQRNVATWWAVSCVRVKRNQMKNFRRCTRSLASRCFLCLKWATLWPPASPAPPLCLTWWDLTGSTPGSLPTSRYRPYENMWAQCGYTCNRWSQPQPPLAVYYLKLVKSAISYSGFLWSY